jgi:hypothetical protein
VRLQSANCPLPHAYDGWCSTNGDGRNHHCQYQSTGATLAWRAQPRKDVHRWVLAATPCSPMKRTRRYEPSAFTPHFCSPDADDPKVFVAGGYVASVLAPTILVTSEELTSTTNRHLKNTSCLAPDPPKSDWCRLCDAHCPALTFRATSDVSFQSGCRANHKDCLPRRSEERRTRQPMRSMPPRKPGSSEECPGHCRDADLRLGSVPQAPEGT